MKKYTVGIIGLSGLKEAIIASKAGHTVIGYDIAKEKIATLNQTNSPISTVSKRLIYLKSGSIFSSDPNLLQQADILIIAVPTPLTDNQDPDLTAVRSAFSVIKNIYIDQIIVLESTTYPGCTEELAIDFGPF